MSGMKCKSNLIKNIQVTTTFSRFPGFNLSPVKKGMGKQSIRQMKTILLVHDSTTSDYSWIEAVKLFLEKWGGFQVLVDFIEIPRSRHKDPLLWYTESMETADSVAVVAPSSCRQLPVAAADDGVVSISTDQRSAIYHQTFDLALELLAMRISRRLKLKERDVLEQFVVLLPATDENAISSIPDVCTSFSRFLVPEEFTNLISYIAGEDDDDSSATTSRAGANNRSFTFADCLVGRRDKESTLMDSFRMMHEHLRQRNKSPAAHVRPSAEAIDDAQHVELQVESCSLLSTQNEEEDRERKRQQLDREFGSGIVSLANLSTLG